MVPAEFGDPRLLDRATELKFPLYTQDDDLVADARRCQLEEVEFAGVIYSYQLRSPVGKCVEDLELIAQTFDPIDMFNRVEFVPF